MKKMIKIIFMALGILIALFIAFAIARELYTKTDYFKSKIAAQKAEDAKICEQKKEEYKNKVFQPKTVKLMNVNGTGDYYLFDIPDEYEKWGHKWNQPKKDYLDMQLTYPDFYPIAHSCYHLNHHLRIIIQFDKSYEHSFKVDNLIKNELSKKIQDFLPDREVYIRKDTGSIYAKNNINNTILRVSYNKKTQDLSSNITYKYNENIYITIHAFGIGNKLLDEIDNLDKKIYNLIQSFNPRFIKVSSPSNSPQ